jgi:hypothetical protein
LPVPVVAGGSGRAGDVTVGDFGVAGGSAVGACVVVAALVAYGMYE